MVSIDEDARKRFESDWLSGRSLAIREYLPPHQTDTYLGTLEELVCIDLEFRWQPQPDEPSDHDETVATNEANAPTRVEDYVRDFPELKQPAVLKRLVEQEVYVRLHAGYVVEPSEYRSRFPQLELDDSLFSLGDQQQTRHGSSPAASGTITFPHQFGNYLLTGQMGQGGMGAVYRARQPAAAREVAIKIADVSSMSASMREAMRLRFETETHAAASLKHDHVVPIYDVGVVNEQPYYAMQLVEGGDLGGMSKAEPLAPRRAAHYVLGVARGIAVAHARGMLHRDIKPQNILVEASNDRAMITDFGLARISEEDSGMTRTGQVLGTPSYMPPEQIRDSRNVDQRADVYSLGATLYQLLCGKAPFKASDVHETLRQVLSDEVVPLRRMNASVDRDLDTICLKCLEKEPRARYQTATEFADELERFLEGKPIVARPAGPVRRFSKWFRRNPRLAASLTVTAVSLLATIAFGAFSLATVTYEQRRTMGTLKVAHGALLEGITQLDDPVFKSPGIEPIRQEILESYHDTFRSLSDMFPNVAQMDEEHAFTLERLGNMTLDLERPIEEAERDFQAALAMLESLPPARTPAPRYYESKSNALTGLGKISRQRSDLPQALEYFRRATELRHQWTEAYPLDAEAQRKLASSISNEGLILRAQDLLLESEGRQQAAQKIRKGLMERGNASIKLRRDLAQADYNLAMLELHRGDMPQVLLRLRSARKQFGVLAAEVQVDSELWRRFAEARLREADFSAGANDATETRDQASRMIHEALDDLVALMQLHQLSASSLPLLGLYQYGIDALISMNKLALAEDELQRFSLIFSDFQRNKRESLEATDAGGASTEEETLRVNLHLQKHRALLSIGLDRRPDAAEAIEGALEVFRRHRDIVERDPLLSDARELLETIRSSWQSQSQ